MIISQVMAKSLEWPPDVGSWLHAGNNSSVSHGNVKEDLFKEVTHSLHGVWPIWEGKRGPRV